MKMNISKREMMNALGAVERHPVNNTDNKLITSGYVLCSGQSTASGCLAFTPLLLILFSPKINFLRSSRDCVNAVTAFMLK